jgi:hypothetical protein
MNWWQILLCVLLSAIWIYFFIYEVIITPIIEKNKYNKNFKNWDRENPDLQRIKCKNCKYAIRETLWSGRYPNGIPTRHIVYCTLIKRKIRGTSIRCIIATPQSEYFYEPKNKKEPYPCENSKIYYSAYGDCFHSTTKCSSIKKSKNIYEGFSALRDRYPCPKCWEEKNGVLYPKK